MTFNPNRDDAETQIEDADTTKFILDERQHSPEDFAVLLVSAIEMFGAQVLRGDSDRILPDQEGEQLRYAVSALRPAFNDLARSILDEIRSNDPALASSGFEHVWKLTRAAFMIGAHASITDAAKLYSSREIGISKAARMREVASANAAMKRPFLRDAIQAEADEQRKNLNKGRGFAKLVRPGIVRRLLNDSQRTWEFDPKGWPSVDLIKTVASEMIDEKSARKPRSRDNS
jgi:hypothetical protein